MPNKRLRRNTIYNAALISLVLLCILVSAFMVVHQVFSYRHDYRSYNKLLKERDDIQAEWGRLLIEQQTFGATAQIGTRAVTQLRMYSPPAAQTVVISTNNNEMRMQEN